ALALQRDAASAVRIGHRHLIAADAGLVHAGRPLALQFEVLAALGPLAGVGHLAAALDDLRRVAAVIAEGRLSHGAALAGIAGRLPGAHDVGRAASAKKQARHENKYASLH